MGCEASYAQTSVDFWDALLVPDAQGKYWVKCANPYDELDYEYDAFGTGVAWANTAVFMCSLLVGLAQARFVTNMYTPKRMEEEFPLQGDVEGNRQSLSPNSLISVEVRGQV